MRKSGGLIILFALVICFIACKKDNNASSTTGASSLSGTWTFTGMHASTSATAVDNGGGIN
ncbi:MAG TPA: hypothetical protein VFI33_07805, partial [Puia sp.]|nr:hypothetical protein [Puia sp.]